MRNKNKFKELNNIINLPVEADNIKCFIALKILIHILNKPEEYNPSLKQLHESIELSINSIRKGLSYLCEHNIIAIKEKHTIGKKNTVYTLNHPNNWKS